MKLLRYLMFNFSLLSKIGQHAQSSCFLNQYTFVQYRQTVLAVLLYKSLIMQHQPISNIISISIISLCRHAVTKGNQFTLSSIVSNLVNIIPSICLGLCSPEKSFNAWLNFVSWSTASLPTSASPTNIILSGSFTVTS